MKQRTIKILDGVLTAIGLVLIGLWYTCDRFVRWLSIKLSSLGAES